MELFTKPAACAIIQKTINNEKHILLQSRFKEDIPCENGLLEIPGGKIREFESVYDCLKREVKEETGLTVTKIHGEDESIIIECNNYKVLNYTPFACGQNIEGYYPIMGEIFICEATGTLLSNTNESKNMHWISLKELSTLLKQNEQNFYPMHIFALKKYLSLLDSNKN